MAAGIAVWIAVVGGGGAAVADTKTAAAPTGRTSAASASASATSAASPPPSASSPAGDAAAGQPEDTIPNRICLDGLRARQIAFVEFPTKGVRTPVKILGPLGAVRLRSHDPRSVGKPALMDCELARALLDAAPAFQALGVRELLFSGAYDYRTRRHSTKLSEHAHGLAIDVHAFAVGARGARSGRDGQPPGADPRAPDAGAPDDVTTVVEVVRDFEPNVGKWAVVADQLECIGHPRTDAGRLLRTLACRLRASSIFREVITPDDNADHHDHFHLEAYPDALTRTRAVLARKPSVTDD